MKVSILFLVDFLLAANTRDAGDPELPLASFSKGCPMYVNSLSLNNDIRGMLEEKDNHAVHIAFPILEAYIDHATGLQNDANLIVDNRI